MEILRRKLDSSRGASILMALLFLLVCMMVGASILMAAASNAGKIRSNKQEQQKYLTLSSALTLICDELAGVEYHGRYQYQQIKHEHTETYADGSSYTWTNYEHRYKQETGSVRAVGTDYSVLNEWALQTVLPLVNDLDKAFAEDFQLSASKKVPLDLYPAPEALNVPLPRSPHVLELAVNVDDSYGGLSEPVNITAQLRNDGGIVLTAALKNDPEYMMEAVLKANDRPDQLFVLDSHGADGTYETKPMKWVLEYVVKKENQPKEEGG